jgi:undecaprenyl-diphosphatase
MGWLQAVLLGLLQGLTEFLPVSSTAHMAIVPQLFGQKDPGAAFSAIVQLGPIAAIILYFRADLARYIQGILRTKLPNNVPADDVDARLGWYTVFGSLPIMVFGLLLEKRIDREFRSLYVVAASMIVLAIILWIAEKIGKRTVTLDRMTLGRSQGVGWAQVLGLIPGASRSGSTITAGLLLGLDRESAARFSFLLGIPAITAAGLYKLYREIKHHSIGPDVAQDLLAMAVAGVFAYVVVRWFMGYMKEHNTGLFIGYRIAFGVILLILLGTGRLKSELPKPEASEIPSGSPSTTLSIPVPHSSERGRLHLTSNPHSWKPALREERGLFGSPRGDAAVQSAAAAGSVSPLSASLSERPGGAGGGLSPCAYDGNVRSCFVVAASARRAA